MECKHEWEEDARFKSGIVMMVTGPINDMRRETRMICKKCKAIDYTELEVSANK